MRSPLPGDRQSVSRGELASLLAVLSYSIGFTVYVTDNQSVMDGWHAQLFMPPSGEHEDLWREIGRLQVQRGFSHIVVLKVRSHTTGADHDKAPTPFWMALGNEVADEIADLAAK